MKKLFMVLDCETATVPFVNEIAHTPEEKKKIAIAKPIIYDIGWIIADRQGNHIDKKHFLITESFAVPSVFNTAYYAEKRPIYIDMLNNGEIELKSWTEVVNILISDMNRVCAVGAYNSMFDFKKAIPYTDLYVSKVYSKDYQSWEKSQKEFCSIIINNPVKEKKESDFDKAHFSFHGKVYDMFDLWGLSVKYLLNNQKYKNACVNNKLYTASGLYFKSSAESTYQYLRDNYGFVEAHTALEDAIIETFILSKIARRHAVEMGIMYFPFRDLGYTYDFLPKKFKKRAEDWEFLYNMIVDNGSKYESASMASRIENIITFMEEYKDLFV